jgi:hypothetical protein
LTPEDIAADERVLGAHSVSEIPKVTLGYERGELGRDDNLGSLATSEAFHDGNLQHRARGPHE